MGNSILQISLIGIIISPLIVLIESSYSGYQRSTW